MLKTQVGEAQHVERIKILLSESHSNRDSSSSSSSNSKKEKAMLENH
jgi:hypothetical protein